MRSADAREDYSAEVDLEGDQRIEVVDDHTLVVLDPSPAMPTRELPGPEKPGSPMAERARGALGLDPAPANPEADARVSQAVERAGVKQPADVDDSDLKRKPRPSGAELDGLVGKPPPGVDGDPDNDDAPSAAELAHMRSSTEQHAERLASDDLAEARERGAQRATRANDDARTLAESQDTVVATITAPDARDAEGDTVQTTLSVEGNIVTLHVDHHGEDVAYPVAADPIYQIEVVKWRIAYYPVMREEIYVSHWGLAHLYIGNWHPVYCAWGWISCQWTGVPAWWRADSGATGHTAYWPVLDWGPVWQDCYYPVFASRLVFSHWQAYWEPYIVLESIEIDEDYASELAVEFTDAQMGAIPVGSTQFGLNGNSLRISDDSPASPLQWADPAGSPEAAPTDLVDAPTAEATAEAPTPSPSARAATAACTLGANDPYTFVHLNTKTVEASGWQTCAIGLGQRTQACLYKKHHVLFIPVWRKNRCGRQYSDTRPTFRPATTRKFCDPDGTGTWRTVVLGSIFYQGPRGPMRYYGGVQSYSKSISKCN